VVKVSEDGIKEYVEFGKRVQHLIKGGQNGFAETIQGTPVNEYGPSLLKSYLDAHLYIVEESTKKLLMMTKPPMKNDNLRLPFSNMFIGCHFTREEIEQFFGVTIEYKEIWGLLCQEGLVTMGGYRKAVELEMGKNLRVVACCELDNGEIEFNTMHINTEFDNDLDVDSIIVGFDSAKKTKKFSKIFVMNVLNLIYDPEIEYVERSRESMREQNSKRLVRGQMPLPGMTHIRLTGKKKIYVDELLAGNHFSFSHKFWVRGTYRQLKSERYVNALHENPTGRGNGIIWVVPHKKGEGILIEKDYEIDVSKEDD
jgi:hypothetical protein